MGKFILNNLELIVAISCSGFIPIFYILKNKSKANNNNDITYLLVQNKRLSENINKQSKSIF